MKEDYLSKLGVNLYLARCQARFSIAEVNAQLGILKSGELRSYEMAANKSYNLYTLLKLFEFYGKPIGYFLPELTKSEEL
jgi:hypothetical protein